MVRKDSSHQMEVLSSILVSASLNPARIMFLTFGQYKQLIDLKASRFDVDRYLEEFDNYLVIAVFSFLYSKRGQKTETLVLIYNEIRNALEVRRNFVSFYAKEAKRLLFIWREHLKHKYVREFLCTSYGTALSDKGASLISFFDRSVISEINKSKDHSRKRNIPGFHSPSHRVFNQINDEIQDNLLRV